MFKILFFAVFLNPTLGVYLPNIKEGTDAQIISYDYKALDDGYTFEYTTSNGITRQETGHIKMVTDPDNREQDEIMDVEGLYSYTGDDGKFYRITYHADENGYVPQVSTSGFRSNSPDLVIIGQKKPTRTSKQQAREYASEKPKKTPQSKLVKKKRY